MAVDMKRSTKTAPVSLSTSYLIGSACIGISMMTLTSTGTSRPAVTRSRFMAFRSRDIVVTRWIIASALEENRASISTLTREDPMKLYMTQSSGNAYKPRLLLEMLKVPYEKVILDSKNKEHKQPPYLAINPRGQVPALEDDGRIFWDSTACLVYIARKHGGEKWLPTDPAGMAEVTQWLALSNNELHYGLQWARGVVNKIKT